MKIFVIFLAIGLANGASLNSLFGPSSQLTNTVKSPVGALFNTSLVKPLQGALQQLVEDGAFGDLSPSNSTLTKAIQYAFEKLANRTKEALEKPLGLSSQLSETEISTASALFGFAYPDPIEILLSQAVFEV